MSPSRLPLGCTSEVIRATEPIVSESSRTPVRARMIAWRARIGPPSSRTIRIPAATVTVFVIIPATVEALTRGCLLYTSDAADEEDSVDLGGRRIIKKKK